MALTVVTTNSNTQHQTNNLVTIQELAVAKEYYRFVVVDFNIVCAINELISCGKGYTREVIDNQLLTEIRAADIKKVRGIK